MLRTIKLSETQEQIAVIDWSQHVPEVDGFIFHPANGGSRGKKLIKTKKGDRWISPEGRRFQRMGVKKAFLI